ncbi:hypothetical protein [Streptomyces sp. MK37H]|uniref:hypothetical protein n=1 Tax=Streptomyces sp. MK37H TaxID=2699117 RepID=UPI001B3655ED|nr:hypothetical protein [Streptomyces sp. MK37H]MBP8535536.1 hypothetical protein [Streptomyces sp. MK37H]
MAAARAAVVSVMSTVLAVAGHHVVFDVSPSWAALAAMTAILFVLAFPVVCGPSTLARQVPLALGAQAVAGWGFVAGGDDLHGWLDRVDHGWPVVAAHAVMTVLLGLMLHAAQDGRLGAFGAMAELRSLCARLWGLLFPRLGGDAPQIPELLAALCTAGPASASPGAIRLADCVVRRGPPLGAPLATA